MDQRLGQQMPQMAQPQGPAQQCHFPMAPPRRLYCHPAPFSAGCGERYFKLVHAHGHSRPDPRY